MKSFDDLSYHVDRFGLHPSQTCPLGLDEKLDDWENLRGMGDGMGGFSLLELMVACLVLTILICIAAPNAVQVEAALNQRAAYDRVETVSKALSAYTICTVEKAANCSNILPLIPAPGTITQRGYEFTFSNSPNFSYSAVPTSIGFSGNKSFFVDQSGIIRCGNSSGVPC